MIDLDSLDGINIISDSTNAFHTAPQQQQQQPPQQQTSQRANNTSSPPASNATSRTSPSSGPMFDSRDENLLTCMLITANVGTIFEESTLLELWFQQLKSYLTKVKPQLVAIHCQEVGGKNFESSMNNVSNFTDKIIGDESIVGDYSRVRIFLDENFESLEKFTALGSLYLIHDSVTNVKLYNFKTAQYEFIEGRNVMAEKKTIANNINNNNTINNNINNNPKQSEQPTTAPPNISEHVEKVKFPPELFPECRWSRKGFMRTRWLFNDCQPLDLVNIHLFHDASNLVAMEKTPSPYAQNRQRALEFALKKLSTPLEGTWNKQSAQQEQAAEVPLFIFGDFNFRLDTNKVIQRITEGVSPVIKRSADGNEVVEVVYHRKNSNNKQPEQQSLQSTSCAPDIGLEATGTKTNKAEDQPDTDSTISGGGSDHDVADGDGVVMTVGKKLFDCENLDEMFRATKNTEWLQELDNELDSFKSQLFEFKISFSPSYPYKEDTSGGYSYMKTRCPAWCDRILFNAAGNRLIHGRDVDAVKNLDSERKLELLQSQGDVIYRLMGNSVPMGDHKPVLLYCRLNLAADIPSSCRKECNLTSASNETTTNESSNILESTSM